MSEKEGKSTIDNNQITICLNEWNFGIKNCLKKTERNTDMLETSNFWRMVVMYFCKFISFFDNRIAYWSQPFLSRTEVNG